MSLMKMQTGASSMPMLNFGVHAVRPGTVQVRRTQPSYQVTYSAGEQLGYGQVLGRTQEEAAKAWANRVGVGGPRYPYAKLVWSKASAPMQTLYGQTLEAETWGIITDPRSNRVSRVFYIWPQRTDSAPGPFKSSGEQAGGCASGTCNLGGR